MWNDRTPAGNRRLAQWRDQWLIEHSTSQQHLLCIDNFVLRNRQQKHTAKPLATMFEIPTLDKI